MAKEVTVLGLEGAFLRGVRLEERNGGEWERTESGSWPVALQEEPSVPSTEAASTDEATITAPEDEAAETSVEENTLLVRAFASAAQTFGRREFSLSLPLSKMLVKCVRFPVERREELTELALEQLDGISPFPDEALAPAVEIVSETDRELVTVVAALPAAASEEVSAALAAAKVHVTRTDVTALGWLRTLWPRLGEVDARRRLVLLDFGDGWDLAVYDDGVLTFLRGLGRLSSTADLVREVTLSLLQGAETGVDIGDVAVCSAKRVEPAVLEGLAAFGPVRTVLVEDLEGGVDGCARREVEGDAFDATPDDWVESRTESRFTRKLMLLLSVAIGIWVLVIGVFYGVEIAYNMMKDRQVALKKEPKHKRAFEEVAALTNRVALIERYSDRAHCALETLKVVTDCLPESEDMTFRTFRYVRGESVRVQGSAQEREDLRTYRENLEAAEIKGDDEEEGTRIFATVNSEGNETQTKTGIRFGFNAFFPTMDGEENGRSR